MKNKLLYFKELRLQPVIHFQARNMPKMPFIVRNKSQIMVDAICGEHYIIYLMALLLLMVIYLLLRWMKITEKLLVGEGEITKTDCK